MIISECIYKSRVSLQYKYTDEYINFLIKQIIYDEKIASEYNILKLFQEKIDIDVIKISALKSRIQCLCGEKKKGKYILSEDINQQMNRFSSFKKNFFEKLNCDNNFLYDNINFKIDNGTDLKRNTILYFLLKCKLYDYKINELVVYLFYFFENVDNNIIILKNIVDNIENTYSNLSLYEVFEFDNIIKKILLKNDINTISDLKNYNIYTILFLLSGNFTIFLNNLKKLEISVKLIIDDLYKNIEEKNLKILIMRNGYIDNKKYTLNEIGDFFNVTRERIRQLESATIKKIKELSKKAKETLIFFYNSELNNKTNYISIDNLLKKYDSDFINKILLLYEYGENAILYNKIYQIIYDSSLNNINEMVNNVICKIGIVAEPIEIKKSDLFSLNVIENNYKKINKKLYLKNGCIYRDLFLDLIENIFPNGFCIGSDDDYNTFLKQVKERYELFDNIPSKHSLEAMILRGNYIQIDRGKYVPNKYSIEMEQELIDKILSYIGQNEFTYYNAIFETYEGELTKIGIKNRYYLKGCIDKYLTDDMITKRDFIICGKTSNTPYDMVVKKLHSFSGKFTKSELKKIFVGMKDYTIYNYLYNEIPNGLIWISTDEFIYLDNYNLSNSIKEQLKEYIEELFASLNTELLTSKKIYAKLKLTNKNLFNSLGLTNGHFELFSLIRALYSDYYFNRPYICKYENENSTRSSVIRHYIEQFDSFNYKMILEYQSKLNIGFLYSYLSFMEEMSDEYVQVSVDEMVKIEKLNISKIKIEEIKRTIDLILDNFKIIDTSKFNGYSLFPKLSYLWNKYLLVGIIRSYLSEFYDIKNTENTYTKTEFIIRRF